MLRDRRGINVVKKTKGIAMPRHGFVGRTLLFARRSITVLWLVVAAWLPGTSPGQPAPADQTFRITHLGTGTPAPSIERFGPSTLVEVGNQKLIFEVGRGATIRLSQIGILPGNVTTVFVTHLHMDHVGGLSDLWLSGPLPALGRSTMPFRIFGPLGTREMMSYLEKAHPSGIAINATDVAEGVVYDREGVRVTAFDVDHGEKIAALGYRVDYRGRSVVVSGDTRFSMNLIKYARGATVIVHEVTAAPAEALAKSAGLRAIMATHTSPEEAGRVFTDAATRLGVFNHINLAGESESGLIRRTRTAYAGALEVGKDLMTIEVEDVPRLIRRDAPQR